MDNSNIKDEIVKKETKSESKEEKKITIHEDRYDHPMYGVYDNDGRKVELEPDYNVKTSDHVKIRSYIELQNRELDENRINGTCVVLLIGGIISLAIGYLLDNPGFGVGFFCFSILIAGLTYFIGQMIYTRKTLKNIVTFIVNNDYSIDDFVVIAERNLKKTDVLKTSLGKIYNLYEAERSKRK